MTDDKRDLPPPGHDDPCDEFYPPIPPIPPKEKGK